MVTNTDLIGNITYYSFNALNEVTQTTAPSTDGNSNDTVVTQYGYDPDGDETSQTKFANYAFGSTGAPRRRYTAGDGHDPWLRCLGHGYASNEFCKSADNHLRRDAQAKKGDKAKKEDKAKKANKGDIESAGQNRHGVADARAARSSSSEA